MTEKFYKTAAKLGHSRELLEQGISISSTITVNDIEQLRDILDDGESEEVRKAIAKLLFDGIELTPDSDASAVGVLRRVENFLHGTAELSAADRTRVQPSFPLNVHAESNPNQTISTPYQLTSPEPIYKMNWGTLTLANGGCLIAYNKPILISIDQLNRTGNPPSPYADINILGATGGKGATATNGTVGTAGGNGTNGYCSSAGIAGPGGTNGSTGGVGIVGGTGGNGGDGFASQSAIISIKSFGTTGTISVATRSGTGGTGAPGGMGGRGGTGGNGGNGVTCGCTGNGGGSGAPGGAGGAGGQGGNGGNAMSAQANIVIYVPSGNIGQIFPITASVPPGPGGPGGPPGGGGPGGGAGSGGKHNGGGSGGGKGATGATGANGITGTQYGTPAQINIEPL
jgi:hypothetical protein